MVTTPVPATSTTRRTKTTLLTILGSIVAPLGISVWQETLVNALTILGATVPAARQAVARAVGDGWLTSQRVGRRSRMALSDETHSGLLTGHQRTMSFGQPTEWAGEWLFVALTVPEDSRALRHHFRTELGWLGFGSLGNGLWISPHPENEAATLRLLNSAEGPGDAYVFTAARPATHTPQQLAAAAWDMEKLRARYLDFIAAYEHAAPRTPTEKFAAWVEMVTRWRHFPLVDPELPERLLPSDWPRQRAYELFHRRMDQWTPTAEDFLRQLEQDVTA
jgi:phenylacetic acid degradation operon negative regulatory protein